ncbi:MAG: hypothetical protein OEY59_06480 [Deltaproteobacteria bacterium]|nr:hypothetical protein [Deltaproteobacteria bacterium]
MWQKITTRILILMFCGWLGLAQAYGLENDKKAKKEKEQGGVDQPGPKLLNLGLSAEFDLPFVYSSNVFSTPSERFINPETGNWASATNTSGIFFNPTTKLGWEYEFVQYQKFIAGLDIEAVQFLGDKSLQSANGNSTDLEMKYEVAFTNHKLGLGYMKGSYDYNYLHKGTGEIRRTKLAKLPEGQRYKYRYTGTLLSYDLKLQSDTRIHFDLKNTNKDYDEVVIFQSLDRKETYLKLSVVQNLGQDFKFRVSLKKETFDYLTHNADDVFGLRVPGTLQNLVDTTNSLKLYYDYKNFEIIPYMSQFKSVDTYQAYWSYKESEIGAEVKYKIGKKQVVSLDTNRANRQYSHETNVLGEIRSRVSTDFEINWEYQYDKKTKAYFGLDSYSQKDVDSYYSYAHQELTLGYVKGF